MLFNWSQKRNSILADEMGTLSHNHNLIHDHTPPLLYSHINYLTDAILITVLEIFHDRHTTFLGIFHFSLTTFLGLFPVTCDVDWQGSAKRSKRRRSCRCCIDTKA